MDAHYNTDAEEAAKKATEEDETEMQVKDADRYLRSGRPMLEPSDPEMSSGVATSSNDGALAQGARSDDDLKPMVDGQQGDEAVPMVDAPAQGQTRRPGNDRESAHKAW